MQKEQIVIGKNSKIPKALHVSLLDMMVTEYIDCWSQIIILLVLQMWHSTKKDLILLEASRKKEIQYILKENLL